MGRRYAHPGSSSFRHLLCPRWLVIGVLLVVFALECRADSPVTIDIGNSNRSTAVLPDEVSTVIIKTERNVTLVSESSVVREIDCRAKTMCTLDLMLELGMDDTVEIVLLQDSRDINQTLTLKIREILNITCTEYPVPVKFSTSTNVVFTCNPPDNGSDSEVMWSKFRRTEEVIGFISDPMGPFINSTGLFTVSANGRNLTVNTMGAEASAVAYYYVPSFRMGEEIVVMAETFISLGPEIMGDEPEFSFEVTFGTGAARNYSRLNCESTTFPPATVTWKLVSEDHPCPNEDVEDKCGVNVITLDDVVFLPSTGNEENLTLTNDAIVRFLDVQYDQDGRFTCTVENDLMSSTRSFTLRVKSPLRPLWPALGIIAVIILVSILMLCSCTIEKVVERKKLAQGSRSPNISPDHEPRTSVSSTGGHSNSRSRNHSAVKRLSSNKPLIDESTL